MNYIIIFITGIAAGFLNTVGGGGSLLTLPMLIFMGIPSSIANGTNRVALVAQNFSAVSNFRRKGYFYPKMAILLSIPAVIGSIIGSIYAINISDEIFNKILGIVMIVVMITIITRPEKKFLKENEIEELLGKRKVYSIIAFFFVGLYGGFIQVGVGFIIILTLSLITGMSLIKVNAIKSFVIAAYIVASLIVFMMNVNIEWGLAIVLSLGSSIGAYIGSNFSVSKGDKYIRIIIIISVIAMAGKLWGIWL